MRLTLFAALPGALVAMAMAAPPSEEVSRTPPSVYAEVMAGLLTPFDEVIAGRTEFPAGETGGITLLSEVVYHRDDAGTLYRAIHLVYHAPDASAVKPLETDTFSFDRERESIFLIEAATIHPDGRRQPVDTKGAFIQTPQHEARNALYTSDAELQVIYPGVAVGAATEVTVLVRENQPVMPGEFAATVSFAASWPVYLRRLVLDMGVEEADRLHLHASQAGVPEAVVTTTDPNRRRLTWERRLTPRARWEEDAPSFEFRHPTLWITTLETWDEVTGWFRRLVADRSDLGPDLAAAVDGWTEGASDRRAIIDILTAVVANEVRYTGLEFGLAGYQPYPCREVWENRYGDCKDKANLLRAMLAHKGIRSHLALVDTAPLGRVEKASPSWRQFNHVILAIEPEQPGADYLFCDPTIKHLPAGSIGFGDSAREVLVVGETGAEWVRTPDLLDSAIRIGAELTLTPDGELGGWFTVATEGRDAASYAVYHGGMDNDGRLRAMQRMVEAFFPGADVVDVDYTVPAGSVRTHQIRAYFVRPARATQEETVRFPYPANWLPEVSTTGERRYPYQAARREESVEVTISLPAGWSVRSVPAAFSAPSEIARFEGAWETADGRLGARLAWHPKRAELTPGEYAVYQRSVRALTAWLEQPVLLAPAEAGTPAATAANGTPPGDLAGFPILPTGEGQLRLLADKFPRGPKDPQRRLALEKILQWFPHDVETVFEARIHLALLDWKKMGDKAFADTIAALLARYGSQVPPIDRAWAEFLEAEGRWDATKDPAAITTLQRLARDESLPPFRRGWSAYQAGLYLAEGDGRAALAFLQPYDELVSDAQLKIVALMAGTYARLGDTEGLRAWAASIAALKQDNTDALLAAALERLQDDWAGTNAASQTAIMAAFAPALGKAGAFPSADKKLASLRAAASSDDARRAFARDLGAWLRKQPPAWWTRKKNNRLADTEALIKHIEARNSAADGKGTVDAILQLLLHHDPDHGAFTKYLRWTLWWLDENDLDDGLLEFIGRKALDLPSGPTDDLVGGWRQFGLHLGKKGDKAGARRIHQHIIDSPQSADYQRVRAGGDLLSLELEAGRVDAALAAIKSIEAVHNTHKWSVDFLYPAMLVHLERGELDRGLELVSRMAEQGAEWIAESKQVVPVQHLLRAARDPASLRRFWQRPARWWPRWTAILTEAGLQSGPLNQPPVVDDYSAIIDRLARAVSARDKTAFLRELDTLARIARAVPIFVNDFATQAARSGALSADLQRTLYECALLMVTDLEPIDPDFDPGAALWEAAITGDLGDRASARAKARVLFSSLGSGGKVGRAALRTWIIFARDTEDEPEAIAAAQALLQSGMEIDGRIDIVSTLSDALLARDEVIAHLTLLERETGRPDFAASSEPGRMLQARLQELRVAGAAAKQLTELVTGWCDRHDLGWLDHVPPATLEDPRFSQLKGPLDTYPDGFSVGEALKYNLLLARDERQRASAREEAFRNAVYVLALSSNDTGRCVEMVLDCTGREALTPGTRATLLAMVANPLLQAGQHEAVARLTASPGAAGIRAEYLASLESAIAALALVDGAPEGWAAAAFARLTDQTVDFVRLAAVDQLLERLVFRLQVAEAEALVAGAGGLAVSPQTGLSADALRLRWTRLVRLTHGQMKFVHALRDVVLALPGADHAPSDAARNTLDPWSMHHLPEAQCLELAAHRLRTGVGMPDGALGVLYALHMARSPAHDNPEFGISLLQLALETPGSDEARSSWVIGAGTLCDIDLPEVRARFEAIAGAFFADPRSRDMPETRKALAHFRAYSALRCSTEPHPPALFEGLEQAGIRGSEKAELQLAFHFSRGHPDDCLRLVDAIDAEALAKPRVYRAAHAVLQGAGRQSEANLLASSALTQAERILADLWLYTSRGDADWGLSLVEQVRRPDLVPDTWFERARAQTRHEFTALGIDRWHSRLRSDWNGLRLASDRLLDRVPDLYDAYYDRALARHHLGDAGGARDDLRVFLQHSLNAPEYQEALALFRQLAPDEVIPPPP